MLEFFAEYRSVFIIVHAFSAAIGIGATLTTDFLFFQFLRDYRISRIESKLFRTVSRAFPVFLTIIILSGVALYLSDPAKYIESSKFMTKMLAVFIILWNGVFLHYYVSPRLQRLDFRTSKFASTKRIAFASGAISMTSWISSYLLGLLSKIPFTITDGIILYFCLLGIGVCGSQIIYARTQKRAQQK